MNRFELLTTPIDTASLRNALQTHSAGAFVAFEGWVRDLHQGRAVLKLDYQAYARLAQAEGEAILAEVPQRFDVLEARCAHRVGTLELGDLAVWVGISAAHRDAAFAACRHAIDEVKRRVPIWKREFYADGDSGWIHPEQ
jgi:molybdopterin synthase catalytic subunit